MNTKTDCFEIVAAAVASALILAMLSYWIVQVLGVREMLRLAHD